MIFVPVCVTSPLLRSYHQLLRKEPSLLFLSPSLHKKFARPGPSALLPLSLRGALPLNFLDGDDAGTSCSMKDIGRGRGSFVYFLARTGQAVWVSRGRFSPPFLDMSGVPLDTPFLLYYGKLAFLCTFNWFHDQSLFLSLCDYCFRLFSWGWT